MFDRLIFNWRLFRIRRSDRAWLKEYRRLVAEARRRRASADELANLEQKDHMEQELSYDAIMKLQTRYFQQQLDKLLLPRPQFIVDTQNPHDGTWMPSRMGGVHMTPKTIVEIRDQIRKERKERSEVFRLWLASIGGFLGTLTGVVGALIGLLAFLTRR